jgi:hypothetical protein
MKICTYSSLLILMLKASIITAVSQPMLVVLLMVKDENKVIIPTLETFLTASSKAGKDNGEVAFVLYDTGSTDGTDTLAKKFFEEKKIKHYLIEKGIFTNFAESRNRALEITRKAYPRSTFILFPDAEWYMHEFEELLTFCRTQISEYETGVVPPPYYCVRMERSDSYVSLTPRLFLTADSVEFEGVVHECPTKYSDKQVPLKAYFEIGLSKFGAEKSKNRWYRDRNLLLQDLQKNPTNSRSTFYLGLTEKWLGHNDIAYIYLKKRIEMPAFPQEDYSALFQLAEVTEQLSETDPKNYTWEEALGYYMQAYEMRPHRAEPLVRLADHYIRKENYSVGYLFARRAAELPLPSVEQEVLSISLEEYDYNRWELLGRAAWYVGEYEMGEAATKKAIEARPNYAHLYSNLACYWERHTK